MNFFRTGKLRFLYWLALAQLVGGPLVLLQVTVFCKLALNEAPRVGMVRAAAGAWKSAEFQATLTATAISKAGETKTLPPTGDPKLKLEKAKLPVIPWEPAPLVCSVLSRHCKIAERTRTWTPGWPQAPPGPPPKVG